MVRWVALILLALLIVLQLRLWIGDGSMREVENLRSHLAEQKRENERLKARNDALSAEVQNLKEGRDAIESRARSELGLIKPGETFYQVVEPTSGAVSAPKSEGSAP